MSLPVLSGIPAFMKTNYYFDNLCYRAVEKHIGKENMTENVVGATHGAMRLKYDSAPPHIQAAVRCFERAVKYRLRGEEEFEELDDQIAALIVADNLPYVNQQVYDTMRAAYKTSTWDTYVSSLPEEMWPAAYAAAVAFENEITEAAA